VKGLLEGAKYGHGILVTATLFAPTLQKVASEFTRRTGIPLQVIAVTNRRLGETITVAGLMMAQDVIEQVGPVITRQTAGTAEVVILPRVMFDHPDGISLDDITPLAVARALGRPVVLADWMGDVLDALKGESSLLFDPALPDLDIPTAREGGWAVEKYL
jgi:hypothetical protein